MADEKDELEWVKFHWDKWREEATRFWRHLALGTMSLLAFGLYQVDVIQFEFDHAKFAAGPNNQTVKKWLIPISFWLLISLLFGLIDFLRHRVPEKYERIIHNNEYPIPGSGAHLDLKVLARWLYLIVVLSYLLILCSWVVYCSWKTLQ